jgi:response regulator of citrate/malate metabolism
MVEYSDERDELSYSFYTNDENLNELLRGRRSASAPTRRMRAIASRIGTNQFTASALASQMGVTDRNIRRIISGLIQAGLLTVVGEEASGESGRPAKLYVPGQGSGKVTPRAERCGTGLQPGAVETPGRRRRGPRLPGSVG